MSACWWSFEPFMMLSWFFLATRTWKKIKNYVYCRFMIDRYRVWNEWHSRLCLCFIRLKRALYVFSLKCFTPIVDCLIGQEELLFGVWTLFLSLLWVHKSGELNRACVISFILPSILGVVRLYGVLSFKLWSGLKDLKWFQYSQLKTLYEKGSSISSVEPLLVPYIIILTICCKQAVHQVLGIDMRTPFEDYLTVQARNYLNGSARKNFHFIM